MMPVPLIWVKERARRCIIPLLPDSPALVPAASGAGPAPDESSAVGVAVGVGVGVGVKKAKAQAKADEAKSE